MIDLDIGVTGTRHGANDKQRRLFVSIINKAMVTKFRHGDCIGFDEESHKIVESISPSTIIEIHPPIEDKHRAYCKGKNVKIHEPKNYLDRNKDIVAGSQLMIAVPGTEFEILHSGTWATIRHMKRIGKPFIILYPDGRIYRNKVNINLRKK